MIIAMTQPNGGVSVSVANHDNTSLKFAAEMQLQKWHKNSWQGEHIVRLDRDCSHQTTTCVELAPGAELFPPAFSHAFCGCKPCQGLTPGRYRFAAQTCDHKRILASEAFEYNGS